MRKCIRSAILGSLMMTTLQLAAQKTLTLKEVNKRLDASQKSFARTLDKYPMDNNGKAIINRFITLETDSLQNFIKNDKALPLSQKILALNCQSYLLDTLQSGTVNRSFDVALIRESRDNFIPLWQTILTQRSCEEIMRPFGPNAAGLMAGVFRDFPQSDKLKDIATLKVQEHTPENIMAFLSNNPNYALRDSLIFIYANNQPEKLVTYVLESKNEELVKAIRQNSSRLVQTLLSIANEKNLKNYFPFVSQLAGQKITLAEIDKMREQPSLYFKAIVDGEIANREVTVSGGIPLYLVPNRKYLKDYAKLFFTDIINSLHEDPNEKVRFAVLEDLRPQDLYFIITTGEDELFTSSYLYTYKKLMSAFEKSSSDLLFDLVKYDQYRKFLLMAGRYNTLAAFLKQMPNDKSISIIKRLLLKLEERDYNDPREIINIAETFPGIVTDNNLSTLTFQEIENNYKRCVKLANPNGIKIYNLLTDIFRVVEGNESGNMSVIPQPIAPYFKIGHSTLVGKDGRIDQLILFFGDDDGKSSFASFLSNYSDASQWSIERTESWVKISSKKLQPVSIYANLPLNNEDGQDIKAQDMLAKHLKELHVEPSILILRGHSYHLINSFKFFSPSIQLGILGSCGGYTEIIEILKKNQRVQVISTKQIGSRQVNEPMLRLMNTKLLNGQDLVWSELWDKLEDQFKGNKLLNDYFKEYVPPYKNIALLVSALYEQSGIKQTLFL